MKDILVSIFRGITSLPRSFGQHPLGGLMTMIIVLYTLYLGAPILSEWLKVEKPEPKVKVNKLEGREDGSGGVFEVEAK
jgi:hypothetical protein